MINNIHDAVNPDHCGDISDQVIMLPRQCGKTQTITNMLIAEHLRRIEAEYIRLAVQSYTYKKRFGRTVPTIRFATTLDGKRIRMRKSESKRFLRWDSLKPIENELGNVGETFFVVSLE
jgi:hypothetical protein